MGQGGTTSPHVDPRPPNPNSDPFATCREVADAVIAQIPHITDVSWALVPEPGEVPATYR